MDYQINYDKIPARGYLLAYFRWELCLHPMKKQTKG